MEEDCYACRRVKQRPPRASGSREGRCTHAPSLCADARCKGGTSHQHTRPRPCGRSWTELKDGRRANSRPPKETIVRSKVLRSCPLICVLSSVLHLHRNSVQQRRRILPFESTHRCSHPYETSGWEAFGSVGRSAAPRRVALRMPWPFQHPTSKALPPP